MGTHILVQQVTTIKEISMHVDNPKGPQLVTNVKKTVTIQEFIFTDKVSVFMICQINSCKKKMPYVIDSPVFSCPSCGTCQKVKGQKRVPLLDFVLRLKANKFGLRPSLM